MEFKVFLSLSLISFLVSLGSSELDLNRFPGEECFRSCNGSAPRICYFSWHLEHYHVLGPACGKCAKPDGGVAAAEDCFNEQCITADGIERGVMSINRKIPGPTIHVCKDDLIVADVVNMMGGTSATIHWHGFHQRKTPFYDGVPFVTQCPIEFSTTFRYAFEATEPGTQFYHSHSGHHKVNGHYGGIVVRRNLADDPNAATFDHDLKEHLIVMSDWMAQDAEMFMPGLRSDPIGIQPTNILINGRGSVHNKTSGTSITKTPLEVFHVERGQRYRFRLVNSLSHICPAIFEVQNHELLIIASDSYDLQPVAVDSLVSTSGERYDFVINANQSSGTFWIRVRALGACESRHLQQFAVLSYTTTEENDVRLAYPTKKFPGFLQEKRNPNSLNHPNTTCGAGDPNNFCITDLSSYIERPDITEVEPDYQFYLGFNNQRQRVADVFKKNHYGHFMNLRDDIITIGAINNISFTFPPISPLTQPEDIREEMFCDENSLPESCRFGEICHCIHRLKVKSNSIVELVVVDETLEVNPINHPFHLHGYQLFVMGMGQHPEKTPMTVEIAKSLMKTRRLMRSAVRKHAIKDTISIPSKGFTIFRFKADNPGWWLLHCHYEWHMAVGMGLVLQVGEPDEMVKPPENFPKCNNFKPEIDSSFLKFNDVSVSISSKPAENLTSEASNIGVEVKPVTKR